MHLPRILSIPVLGGALLCGPPIAWAYCDNATPQWRLEFVAIEATSSNVSDDQLALEEAKWAESGFLLQAKGESVAILSNIFESLLIIHEVAEAP